MSKKNEIKYTINKKIVIVILSLSALLSVFSSIALLFFHEIIFNHIGEAVYITQNSKNMPIVRVFLFNALIAFFGASIVLIFFRKTIQSIKKIISNANRDIGNIMRSENVIVENEEFEEITQNMHNTIEVLRNSVVTKEYLNDLIESMINSLIIVSTEGKILKANSSAYKLLGYKKDELLGEDFDKIVILKSMQLKELFLDNTNNLEDSSGFVLGDVVEYIDKNGSKIPVFFSATTVKNYFDDNYELICVAQDIREKKIAEEKVKYLAQYDILTGLANRRTLRSCANKQILINSKKKRNVVIFFMDLDRFKVLNDSLGHEIGDRIIKIISKKIKKCSISNCEIVARIGGDKFAITAVDIELEDIKELAKDYLKSIREAIIIDDYEVAISVSIGISIFPSDFSDYVHGEFDENLYNGEVLVKNAEAAMYFAKEKGGNNYQFYDGGLTEYNRNKMQLETDLRRAITHNEFYLNFQPIIDIEKMEISGVEALIRWKCPKRGVVSPVEFIPISEESGLIVPIGEWVIATACQSIRTYNEENKQKIVVSINFAVPQFYQKDLIRTIEQILKSTKLTPDCLKVEITESIFVHNMEETIKKLNQLRNMGVEIYIDDFGTGYSSLTYIKMLPIDGLKIDMSFIRDMMLNNKSKAIVKTIINMAHNLGIKVVAEGVETKEQFRYLKEIECDYIQGYLFSKPFSIEELSEFKLKSEDYSNV